MKVIEHKALLPAKRAVTAWTYKHSTIASAKNEKKETILKLNPYFPEKNRCSILQRLVLETTYRAWSRSDSCGPLDKSFNLRANQVNVLAI